MGFKEEDKGFGIWRLNKMKSQQKFHFINFILYFNQPSLVV